MKSREDHERPAGTHQNGGHHQLPVRLANGHLVDVAQGEAEREPAVRPTIESPTILGSPTRVVESPCVTQIDFGCLAAR